MSDALLIVRTTLSILELAERASINVQRLQALRERAALEGRTITDEELELLATEAQGAVDRAKLA